MQEPRWDYFQNSDNLLKENLQVSDLLMMWLTNTFIYLIIYGTYLKQRNKNNINTNVSNIQKLIIY